MSSRILITGNKKWACGPLIHPKKLVDPSQHNFIHFNAQCSAVHSFPGEH
jgi:hypothetical protein